MPVESVIYPTSRDADVALRDGSTVHVRPVRADDEAALVTFYQGLSLQSRWLRFFSGAMNLGQVAAQAAHVDYRDRYGLIAAGRPDQAVVAHACYIRTATDRAEVAFAVSDSYQGRGLGTLLLGQLAEEAQRNGIAVFEAMVLPDNHRMIEVFRESGFGVQTRVEPGEIHVEFPTSFSPEAVERFDRREEAAAVNAMRAFFQPQAVAVIGASRKRGTIGGEVFHNLLSAGFPGPVYPVNVQADVVQSVPAYHSVVDIPRPVGLAVIVVPASEVVEVARQCAAKGVQGIVVISAGFAEAGLGGAERQRNLLAVCRRGGHAADRAELYGHHQHRARGVPQRHVCPRATALWQGRFPFPEWRPRPRRDRLCASARPGTLNFRLRGQQGRYLWQ